MVYTEDFKEFVNDGIGKYYVGIGNPNAKILFIGKESAVNEEEKAEYLTNAKNWSEDIIKDSPLCLNYDVDDEHPLRKRWGKNTWSKYQKLTDIIFNKIPENYKVDFLENVFTTEINDSPNKKTASANKIGLNDRKELFSKSDFIKHFSVVVLACSNYIKNRNGFNDIGKIFDATYDGDATGKYWYNKGNWFFVHHSEDKKKLVIHTRQLSADVKIEMLQAMGTVIREHLDRTK